MQIVQTFDVAHPVSCVWAFFADVLAVASCMPGAQFEEQIDAERYRGRMSVRLGPLAAAFATEVTVTRDDRTLTGVVEGRGVDQRTNSRVQSKLVYTLAPKGGATTVRIQADVALSGALAQFGRSGIVQDVAARLTAEFAKNLHERLSAGAAEAASAPAAELRAGRLFFAAFLSWLKRVLRLA